MAKNSNGNGQTVVTGGSGSTTVQATATSTKINGGDGNDSIVGGTQIDDIRAGNGNDTINGGAGNDVIFGNDGYDVALISDLKTLSVSAAKGNELTATSSDGVDALKQVEAISDGRFTYVVGQNNGVFGLAGTLAAAENGTATFDAFANAFDVEDDAFSVVGATNSSAGAAVTFTAGGAISYAPGSLFDHLAVGQTATDTFSYTVRDAAGNVTTQTVSVTITGANDAPTITGGTVTGAAAEDGQASASGSLTATDPDNGDALSWSVQGGGNGAYGSLSVNANGGWSYTLANGSNAVQSLAAGQNVTDSFTVEVSDGKGGTDSEVVQITITGANDAPVIADSAVTGSVSEDGAASAAGTLSATDIDAGNSLSWSLQGNGAGQYGTFTVNAAGEWGYALANGSTAVQSLAAGQRVTDSFTVEVSDGNGGTDSELVEITITGANDAPTITGGTISGAVSEDDVLSASGSLTAADGDTGDSLNWSLQGNGDGDFGSFAINASGQWTYTLDNDSDAVQDLGDGESVTESFTVQVSDGKGGVDTQDVTITIGGADDGMSGNLLLDFEDLQTGFPADGYQGFDWNSPQGNFGMVLGRNGGPGGQVNQTPGNSFLWANGGIDPWELTRSDGADFDFIGGWTAAQNGSSMTTLRFEGWDDGQLVGSVNVSLISNGPAQYVTANFGSIDLLRIVEVGGNTNFAVDNLEFFI